MIRVQPNPSQRVIVNVMRITFRSKAACSYPDAGVSVRRIGQQIGRVGIFFFGIELLNGIIELSHEVDRKLFDLFPQLQSRSSCHLQWHRIAILAGNLFQIDAVIVNSRHDLLKERDADQPLH